MLKLMLMTIQSNGPGGFPSPVVMARAPKCVLATGPADCGSTIRDAIRISNDQAAQALPFRGYKALLIRKPTSSETAAAFSNVNHFRISC